MGADVFVFNNQAMRVACIHGNLDIVKAIYAVGDVEDNGATERTYEIMLTGSASSGNIELVEYLIRQKGLDPTFRNIHCIKYMVKEYPYKKEMIQYLFDNKAVYDSLAEDSKERIKAHLEK